MKIATWNVNSLKVRLAQVLDWMEKEQPDVLALQETKTPDEKFPLAEIQTAGYRASYSGQKTYNGVALLSKATAAEPVTDIPSLDDPQRRILAVSVAGVRVVNLYVVNGQEVGSEKFEYKLHWLKQVHAYLQSELANRGIKAATESMMMTSTAPLRTSISVISSASSPDSGWLTSKRSSATPHFLAQTGFIACSASTTAATPPSA